MVAILNKMLVTKTFRFEREDLGLLVDFLAELFKEDGHKLIGIRGMPRVGKQNRLSQVVSVRINDGYL